MSQKVDTSEKTFTADGAIPIHSLVRMTATGVDVCGIAHHAIGTATRAAFASGDAIAVKLISGSGTPRPEKLVRLHQPLIELENVSKPPEPMATLSKCFI